MLFTSTRERRAVSAAEAIVRGIAPDGGLFVPETFSALSRAEIAALVGMNYQERAAFILKKYLTDFADAEIETCVKGAYEGTFERNCPAPIHSLNEHTHILELWHGPTCAFKDMALQILPYLLTAAAHKSAPGRTMVILVATSGDTGKAALAGFADVPDTRIIVFYPENGVSAMQKLQMTTQRGANVSVCGIKGNFDDAQSGVKAIFSDAAMKARLDACGMDFSSANSINFGRLVPQVVYYVSGYCDLVKEGKISLGDAINVAVPTGNFGNILAAYYAKRMGIPVARFICASNRNRILTDFLSTGVYDRNREFYTTTSPSMDILISSNLERLLYHLTQDASAVRAMMAELREKGKYTVPASLLALLQKEFACGCCDDRGTEQTIADTFAGSHYLCDTHTAVALNVYGEYVRKTGDRTPCLLASTASPYKFAPAVLPAVSAGALPADGFAVMEKLSEVTGTPIPEPLAALRSCKVLHSCVVRKDGMADFILRSLNA